MRVVFTKYDGRLHWHYTMRYLGQDAHGTWLGTPPGLVTQRGSEPAIVIEFAHVMLIPRGTWWTAIFNAEPAGTEIYCDIGTPARWPRDDEVTMADLDLDVIRRRAGQHVTVVDVDEFAEHQREYGYPADVIAQAEQAAAWLSDQITAGAQPFAGDYLGWLAKVS